MFSNISLINLFTTFYPNIPPITPPKDLTPFFLAKAKEAEDVPKKVTRARSLSTTSTQPAFINEEIANKSSHLWKCVDRYPNVISSSVVGFIYIFRMRKKYNSLNDYIDMSALMEKHKEIAPAYEPFAEEVIFLDPDVPKEELLKIEILKERRKCNPSYPTNHHSILEKIIRKKATKNLEQKLHLATILRQLGYSCNWQENSLHISVPDADALNIRWKMLQEKNRHFPNLHVVASAGITKDLPFLESFFTQIEILSSDGEFIHDHFTHVIKRIGVSITDHPEKKYEAENLIFVKMIMKNYGIIMQFQQILNKNGFELSARKKIHLEIILASMSALVDVIRGLENFEEYDQLHHLFSQDIVKTNFLNHTWNENSAFRKNFEERFGNQNVTELCEFWNFMKETVNRENGDNQSYLSRITLFFRKCFSQI